MGVPDKASSADLVGLGIACAAGGVYFMLVGLGVLPEPGDTTAHAPAAIIVAAGLAFVFAGLTCVVRAKAGMSDRQDDVPDSAPLWTRLAYRALGIGVAGALAIIGTWIAIGRARAHSRSRRRLAKCAPPARSSAAPCSGSARSSCGFT